MKSTINFTRAIIAALIVAAIILLIFWTIHSGFFSSALATMVDILTIP